MCAWRRRDRKAVAAETDRICRDTGFLCILGHGVPDEVTQAVYDISNVNPTKW
ncbi:MAG: hypothetical protein OXC26_08860 [Albidovulum sp.]|nr:hypothetical protein [Albidovulum sp.]